MTAPEAVESDSSESADDEAVPRRRRRWPYILAAVLVVLAIGAGVFIWQYVTSKPGEAPLTEALEELQASTTTLGDSGNDGPVVKLRPAEGLYVYAGEGTERISFPPHSQEDGEQMPASVVHNADGCWTFKIDYNEWHWQDWLFCPDEDRMMETVGHTFQKWDFVAFTIENLSTFECEPPNAMIDPHAEPGDSWTQSCVGTNEQVPGSTTTSGSYELVGTETLTVGDEEVQAYHYRQERQITGAQDGSQQSDWWFSTANGLPLKTIRGLVVDTDSPLGTITYTEDGTYELTSLAPQG
ncbi:MAG: hypothetical protein EDR02_07630 [Actinobacteria bacterium]|nr:MAG: hypothetical protein EDR02_07630 [Actinomycetota bacterium]RIK06954.1 MAG: hypothetical protein DCC48_05570 [Acidobacteriota bacterium]